MEELEASSDRPKAPRVGILTPIKPSGEIDLHERWAEPFLNRKYLNHKYEVALLRVDEKLEDVDRLLNHLDGFLLPGGDSDISEEFRNASSYDVPVTKDKLIDEQRDEFATQLARKLLGRGLTTLAICRGMQEVGVAFGAPLEKVGEEHAVGYADGKDHMQRDEIVHDVIIQPRTILSETIGEGRVGTNSIHRDGFFYDRWPIQMKYDFKIESISVEEEPKNRLVEAFSSIHRAIFAIQGHPEWNFGEGRNQWHKAIYGERFGRIEQHFKQRLMHPVLP
ncbi:MAG: gamma-glutamyl-gamma-aminobutyrate hydrolase family protein [Pseudomonadota bacterium]